MVKRAAVFLAALPLFVAPLLSQPVPPDFVIDAGNRVGSITPFSSEANLIGVYGADAVTRGQINFGGETASVGTILFAGTDREAIIRWRGDFDSPQLVKISEPSTPWITADGITIGTTLEDLEEINGRPFVIASYNLNYGARTMSWEDGAFARELVLDLGPADKLTADDVRALGNGMTHLSSNPIIRKLRFSVRSINVTW